MELLLLTTAPDADVVLPALSLLAHEVRIAPPTIGAMLDTARYDVVLIDTRDDPVGARGLCRLLKTTGITAPVVAVVTAAGLVVVSTDWMLDDILLPGAGPAEIDMRLRLSHDRANTSAGNTGGALIGELVIDEATHTALLKGRPLQLTHKEFELLKYLAQHPGRVFTRAHLLQEVWGYNFFGGTRTVDVHVRQLRAKLGPQCEQLIGTVRHVGYKFVRPARVEPSRPDSHQPGQGAGITHAPSPGTCC